MEIEIDRTRRRKRVKKGFDQEHTAE